MLLSKHVPANIKRRVWVNKYVDFAYLIESDPTEETPYQFVQSTTNPGTLTLAQAKSSCKIDGWVSWNKALQIFTEIYCMKYPNKCMQLLQYSGILNNLSSWFPFDQVYRYDKEFRAELDWHPNKDWHIINTQLWSMALHGVHTLPNQGNPKQYSFKPKNPRRPRVGMDNQFRNCFDHNQGGCNCPSCSFPHVCGRCGSPSHTTPNCPQGQSQHQPSQAAIQQSHNVSTRTALRATNTNQNQQAQRAPTAPSRQ